MLQKYRRCWSHDSGKADGAPASCHVPGAVQHPEFHPDLDPRPSQQGPLDRLQRPDGRLVLSAGINARVEHRLSLGATRNVRLWASRYRVNRGNVRIRFDPTLTVRQLRDRSRLSTGHIPIATEPPAPRRADIHAALAALKRTMPAFETLRIDRYWSGMLDISPDGLPIIDHRAGPDGLVFATGLSGHGLALGPVIGEISADLALNGATARPIRPFRLARFREEPVALPDKMI
jgi:sarcosine oxidase, subunit beta